MQTYSDLIKTLKHWRIWYMLAMQDIKLRYRRSALGPFWITISMAITIYSMGFLYSRLFHSNLQEYFPYLTSGIICWSLIAMLINESAMVFTDAEAYIKNIYLPQLIFTLRLVLRSLIIFAHNIVAFIPILIIFKTSINFHTLLLIPGLFIICLNALFYCSIIGMVGTRYRDVGQIIVSIVQVIFFLTPIMWMPTFLSPTHRYIVDLNPFNQFLNLIRNPLLGQALPMITIITVFAITLLGAILFTYTYNRYRTRIVYWI